MKSFKKKLNTLTIMKAACITIGVTGFIVGSLFSLSGLHLVEVGGETFLLKDGEIQKGLQTLDNKTYFFNNEGIAIAGLVETHSGDLMYFDPETKESQKGKVEIANIEYTFDDNGILKRGWQSDGSVYSETGDKLTSGLLTMADEKKILLDADGKVRTGWIEDEKGVKRYFQNDGVMAVGEITIDDKKYNFQSDGSFLTGWQVVEIPVEDKGMDQKSEDAKESDAKTEADNSSPVNSEDKTDGEEKTRYEGDEPSADLEELPLESGIPSNDSFEEISLKQSEEEIEEKKEESDDEDKKVADSKAVDEEKDSKEKSESDNSDKSDSNANDSVKTVKKKIYYTRYGYQVKDKLWNINKKTYAFDKEGYLLTESNSKFYVNEDGTARLMSEWETEQEKIKEEQRKLQEEHERQQQELIKQRQEQAKNVSISESDNKEDFTASEMQSMVATAYALLGDHSTCTYAPALALSKVYGGSYTQYQQYPSGFAQYGRWVSQEEARPGSIIIYQNHVALYIGDGRAIHGNYNGTTVIASVECSNPLIGFIQPQH